MLFQTLHSLSKMINENASVLASDNVERDIYGETSSSAWFVGAFVETPDLAGFTDRIRCLNNGKSDCARLMGVHVLLSQDFEAMKALKQVQHAGIGGDQVQVVTMRSSTARFSQNEIGSSQVDLADPF